MPAYDDSLSPPAPVARVSLRHPGSSLTVTDVLMLIDSGADVTLIPKSSFDLFVLVLKSTLMKRMNRQRFVFGLRWRDFPHWP